VRTHGCCCRVVTCDPRSNPWLRMPGAARDEERREIFTPSSVLRILRQTQYMLQDITVPPVRGHPRLPNPFEGEREIDRERRKRKRERERQRGGGERERKEKGGGGGREREGKGGRE